MATRLILGRKMPEAERAEVCTWAKERSPQLNVVEATWHELDHVLRIGS